MNVSIATQEQVKALLARHQKINAVKLVHDTARCSLKEAKEYVDALEAGQSFTPAVNTLTAANIDAKLNILLERGDKLAAIKLYREYSREDLAASKDYVDRLEQQLPYKASTAAASQRKPVTSTPIDQALRQQAGATRTNNGTGRVVIVFIALLLIALLTWVLMRQ